MKYNIIFLDFDGLLNNIPELISRQRNLIEGQTKEYDLKLKSTEGLDEFWANEMCWSNFKPMIKCLSNIPNVKIVLSTSWRTIKNVDHWNYQFNLINGWDFEIIDKTPNNIYNSLEYEIIGGYLSSYCRGIEIDTWLRINKDKVSNYCVIDDEADMLIEQENNFVKTNQDIGFCDEDIYKVWKIFGVKGADVKCQN